MESGTLETNMPGRIVKIKPERIQKLLKGYPKRLEEVIKAKGGHTKY